MNSNKEQVGDVGLGRIFLGVYYATDLISSLRGALHISKICMRPIHFLYPLQLASAKGHNTEKQQIRGKRANRILDTNFGPGLSAEGSYSPICC